jgi:hypothetical protein
MQSPGTHLKRVSHVEISWTLASVTFYAMGNYVTMLYDHFHVSSRAELLAYFIRRKPLPRPETVS